MYAKIQGDAAPRFPYSIADLKKDYPQTSFPSQLTDGMLAQYDVMPVITSPVPAFDSATHSVLSSVAFVDGQWRQEWKVSKLSVERASANVRARRNGRLADSDWTQLSDAPVSAAPWASYRQALRDISDQPGFPWEIEWPEEPA